MVVPPQGEQLGHAAFLRLRRVPGPVLTAACHTSRMLQSAQRVLVSNSTLVGPAVLCRASPERHAMLLCRGPHRLSQETGPCRAPLAWGQAGCQLRFGSLTAAETSAWAEPLPLVKTRERTSGAGADSFSFIVNAPRLPVPGDTAGGKQMSCPLHLLLKFLQCSLLVQESDSSSQGCRSSWRRAIC